MIYHKLQLLLSELHEASNEEESQEQTAMRIHKNSVLTPLFRHVKTSEHYVSHSTCFSCLIAPPQHALPCGHVICTPCLQATGVTKGKTVVEVQACPLWHERPTTWNRPWQIVFKPASAGVRILTLDGLVNTLRIFERDTDIRSPTSGGVRGIAELEILKLIQAELGGKMPIREFFDLIVGTRQITILN